MLGLLDVHVGNSEGIDNPILQEMQETLKVPKSVARVTDAYWPDRQNPPDYFLIQDVHRHPHVQAQIAALIERGYREWGVKKVFMEGAFTGVDLSMFHRVPQGTQTILLERLVTEGQLSGPEVAAIHIMEDEWRNPPASPFQLFGLEDPVLYRKNILAYQSVVSTRDRALDALLPIRRLQETIPPPNSMMDELDRTEDLLRLKLTPTEYEAYLKGRASVPSTPLIDPAVHAAEEFYQLAEERSHVFLDTAAKKSPASTAPRILVVGGFHTAFMATSLKRTGQTFVILAPIVTAAAAEDSYHKNLQQTANALSEALSPTTH